VNHRAHDARRSVQPRDHRHPTPIPQALDRIGEAITVIGSSATPPITPDYERAHQLAQRLGEVGYAIPAKASGCAAA
jgi:hypothetical protein